MESNLRSQNSKNETQNLNMRSFKYEIKYVTREEQRRLISLSIWQMNDWEDHILRTVLAKQLTGDLTITMWIVKCLLLLYQWCVVVLL